MVTADGIIDLTPEFGRRFQGLKEAIEAGALPELIAFSEGRQPDFSEAEFEYLIPIANPEKIICVGVNFPDRNAEYKDGQAPRRILRFSSAFRAASPDTTSR